MNKIWSIVVTVIGIMLILPLLGVDTFGYSIEDGVAGWVTAIGVLVLGLESVYRNFLKK